MSRFRLRIGFALAISGALVGCDLSSSDTAASAHSSFPATQSEASKRSPENKSAATAVEEGNFGMSIGDMRYNAFRECMDRHGDKPAYEETCNAESRRKVLAEGSVIDAEGREWSTLDNESGAVVSRGKTRYYLGNSCDARSNDGLIGSWEKKNIDSFTVILADRRIEFQGSVLEVLTCLDDR